MEGSGRGARRAALSARLAAQRADYPMFFDGLVNAEVNGLFASATLGAPGAPGEHARLSYHAYPLSVPSLPILLILVLPFLVLALL